MIIRPPQSWFVRLFNWHGSVLSMIIFRLGLNLFMSIVAIIAWPYYENLNIHLTVAPFSLLGIAIGGFWAMSTATTMRLVPADKVPKALAVIFSSVSIFILDPFVSRFEI